MLLQKLTLNRESRTPITQQYIDNLKFNLEEKFFILKKFSYQKISIKKGGVDTRSGYVQY